VGRDGNGGTGHREWDGTPGVGRDTGIGTGHWDWDGTLGLGRDTGIGTGHWDWDGTLGLGRDTGIDGRMVCLRPSALAHPTPGRDTNGGTGRERGVAALFQRFQEREQVGGLLGGQVTQ
jgi:hypothetical protein